MDWLLTALGDLPPLLIYLTAAVLLGTETGLMIGLVLPAEGTLLLVGFLAYTGKLDMWVALVVLITAAALGDSFAFRAGRRYGPRLRASRLGRRVGEERWARADDLIARHGGRAMLIVRWLAFVRTLAPRLAGASAMPYRRFLPWDLAGVVSWVGASIIAGYLAGESWTRLSVVFGRATGAVLGVAATVLVLVLAGRRLARWRRERADHRATPDGAVDAAGARETEAA